MAGKKTNVKSDSNNGISAEKYYRLVSKMSGKAIDAETDEALWMGKSSRKETQLFSFVPVEDGWYRIVHKKTGKVLDIMLAGVNDGAQIHLWDFTGADNQLWSLEPAGKDCYKIKSKASGKCVDIVALSMEEEARIQIWEDVGGESQVWVLKEAKIAAKKAETAGKTEVKKPAAKAKAARTTKKK